MNRLHILLVHRTRLQHELELIEEQIDELSHTDEFRDDMEEPSAADAINAYYNTR